MAKTSGGVRGGNDNSSKKLAKALKVSESAIRRNRYESAILYTSGGKKIFEKKGETYSVSFDENDMRAMKDGVMTHNHPRALGQKGILAIGNSFSGDDLHTAVKADLKEIRAVTPTYTFSMKRPKGGWGVSSEEFRKTYKKVESQVRAEFEDRARKGTSSNFLNVRHFHEVSKRIANIYGWEYSKRKG